MTTEHGFSLRSGFTKILCTPNIPLHRVAKCHFFTQPDFQTEKVYPKKCVIFDNTKFVTMHCKRQKTITLSKNHYTNTYTNTLICQQKYLKHTIALHFLELQPKKNTENIDNKWNL